MTSVASGVIEAKMEQIFFASRNNFRVDFILVEATTHMHASRHLVPIRLTKMPRWLYFRSVSSSEKLVKL